MSFTALINALSWRKAEADAAAFSNWGGSISGKLGQHTDKGVEVLDAGVKIFEKRKASEPQPEAATTPRGCSPIL